MDLDSAKFRRATLASAHSPNPKRRHSLLAFHPISP
jgi:hypothetical protein